MKFWIKDTTGSPSASLTFATIGFFVVTLWLVVSIVSKIGHIDIRQFDGGGAMGYLTPLLALYFGRRWTDGTKILDIDPNAGVKPVSAQSTPAPAVSS